MQHHITATDATTNFTMHTVTRHQIGANNEHAVCAWQPKYRVRCVDTFTTPASLSLSDFLPALAWSISQQPLWRRFRAIASHKSASFTYLVTTTCECVLDKTKKDCSLCAMPEEGPVMIFRECLAEKVMKLTIRPRLRSPKSRFDDRVHELPEQELRSCINVLFVCKTLHRIALPHFYATVTIYWNQFILKRAGFLTRPDFYYIIPLNRLRNLCSTKQHVG